MQSNNEEHLLNEVLQELSGSSFVGDDLALIDELQKSDMDFPDLHFPDLQAEFPLGDEFPNLDFLLAEQMNNESNVTIEEIDTNSEVLSPISSLSEIDDILCQMSSSSDESDFNNNIVDNIFDSDFIQQFLDNDSLSSTTEVSTLVKKDNSSLKNGCKRKSSESPEKECKVTTKCVKYNEDVLPVEVKSNETEKEAVRRIKNNEASKVTRAKRKQKQGDLFKQEAELLQSNAKLNIQIEVMHKEAEILRKLLVSKLSSIKS